MTNQQNAHPLSTEPDAHVLSRHFRTGVRTLLAAALVATIVAIVAYPQVAYLAAIPVPVLCGVMVLTNYLVLRSRASELRKRGSDRIGKEEIEVDVETAGIILLLKVIGILAIGTFIIAAAFFEWKSVGIVAATLFLLAVLINLPYLPLFFTEAERDELDHLRSQNRDHQ